MKRQTYSEVISLIENSGDKLIYVTAHYKTHYDWLPVDKQQYLELLKLVDKPDLTKFPCWFEVGPDGEMYIHTKA